MQLALKGTPISRTGQCYICIFWKASQHFLFTLWSRYICFTQAVLHIFLLGMNHVYVLWGILSGYEIRSISGSSASLYRFGEDFDYGHVLGLCFSNHSRAPVLPTRFANGQGSSVSRTSSRSLQVHATCTRHIETAPHFCFHYERAYMKEFTTGMKMYITAGYLYIVSLGFNDLFRGMRGLLGYVNDIFATSIEEYLYLLH